MLKHIHAGKVILGTIGYMSITYPLAYVWHLVAFVETYRQLGYFSREEPIIAFGFGSILLQGILLSVVYPFLCRGKPVIAGAITIAAVMGGYHWTMHVLAEAAKHPIAPLATWFALESLYLIIQFVIGGLLRRRCSSESALTASTSALVITRASIC